VQVREIAADANMIRANKLDDVIQMVEHVFDRGRDDAVTVRGALQQGREPTDSYDAAHVRDFSEHFVRLVPAGCSAQSVRASVGYGYRFLRVFDRIPSRSPSAVGNVDEHAKSVALRDDLKAKRAQARIVTLGASGTYPPLDVVRQLEDSYAQVVERC